ncbi:DGQHR domain-containing protein [Mesorhizobium sp. M0387]|uniref:DGQHR domain-containing protein n=1 Tax=Mesorhizobium sp. M0387 TaxID=2956940 RepID=UPI0033362823
MAKKTAKTHTVSVIEVTQGKAKFHITKIKASVLANISYASVRGVDKEEGAVQRILSIRRINSIKEYVLTIGQFPSSIILNWNDERISFKDGNATFLEEERTAQLIDGQHRVAGLRAAISERPTVGNLEIPVSIYRNLSTTECANIFLSINTEQKPVPRSLVFDLYGVADSSVIDHAAARARDIATALNEDDDSPYRELIKFPGSPVRRGGIALSTAVTAIKPLVSDKGDFEQRGIVELETQKKIITNWFKVLQKAYGEKWYENTNAFMYASGFTGATEFLRTKLLTVCQDKKSFTEKTMANCFLFDQNDLILQEEVKGKGGREAPQLIEERLMSFFKELQSVSDKFEV